MIKRLVRDLKYQILIYLSLNDLIKMCVTNSKWVKILKDDLFWQRKTKHDFGQWNEKLGKGNLNWKDWYKYLIYNNSVLYHVVDNEMQIIAKGVKKLCSHSSLVLYIGVENSLYTPETNSRYWPSEDHWTTLFRQSERRGSKLLLLREVEDLFVGFTSNLLLRTNHKLYLIKDREIFLMDLVKEIGGRGDMGYCITFDEKGYIIDMSSGDITFVTSKVKKIQIVNSKLFFCLTNTEQLLKFNKKLFVKQPGHVFSSSGWTSSCIVQTNLIDFAYLNKRLMLVDRQNKLYFSQIREHELSYKLINKVTSLSIHNDSFLVGCHENKFFSIGEMMGTFDEIISDIQAFYYVDYGEYFYIKENITHQNFSKFSQK